MSRKSHQTLFLLSLLAAASSMQACFDIDDYVKYVKEEEPEPEKPIIPEDKTDIPAQGEDNTKPGGSGGIISSDDEDNPLVPPQDSQGGGEVVIPEVLSIELAAPASGNISGGYEIRLHGTQLSKDGILQFGTLQAPTQIWVNTNVVRAVVPAGKKGCVDLKWTQNDTTLTLPDGFCYTQDLSLNRVQPASAAQNTLTEIQITGSGFDSTSRIYLSDGQKSLPLIQPVLRSDTLMTGFLPALNPGKIDILATSSQNHTALPQALEIHPELTLNEVTPQLIATGSQQKITVSGTGFDDHTLLRFGNTVITPTLVSNSEISFSAPSLTDGVYDILAYNSIQQKRLSKAIRYYTDDGKPHIYSIFPSKGSTSGGESIRISGVHLPETAALKFDTETAAVIAKKQNAWEAQTPAHTPGTVDVSIGDQTLPAAFTYIDAPRFTATDISPKHALVGENTYLTLQGTGLSRDLRVSFGSWEASDIEIVSSGEAKILIPPGAGTVPVIVEQNDQSYSFNFTYDQDVEITGVSPSQSVITGQTAVHIYGAGFTSDMTVKIAGENIPVTEDHPGHLIFNAPAHEVGTEDVQLICSDGSNCGSFPFTWFNPTGINTSASGGPIHGQVHVTVLTVATGVPIPNATVYLGTDLKTARTASTDENGMVSFFDDKLSGAMVVMACAPNHSCNTMQPIDAANITLLLEKWDLPSESTPDIEEPPPKPPEGNIINPIEVVIPYTPQQPYFTGTVGGFGKVDLISDPDLVQAGLVMQSALSTYTLSHDKEDIYLLFNPGDTYKIKARKGNVALALLCGMYNTKTRAFYPQSIGFKRHNFVNDGNVIVNHLECPLPLNQAQSIKLLDAPLNSGPNVVYGNAYIFLGEEGYIGGFMSGYSDSDYVVITQIPPFRDELEDASLSISVGAYTNYGSPSTVFYEDNVIPSRETIEVGPAAPIPIFQTQSESDILKAGHLAWSVEYPQNVDFYALTLRMYTSTGYQLYAQYYLPGSATEADIPTFISWPEDASFLYIQLTAYKSIRSGFDFNLFSTGDLRYNYIHSSASSAMSIRPVQN